ncbi:MAG: hypothetical protein JW850_10485 [Thermoflexales bacterium]|nr:hypothetical protein [Thermoflexales bacterium]
MNSETGQRDKLMGLVFALLGLAVLASAGYISYLKWRSPMLDFTLARYNSNEVYETVRGGQAQAAGLRAGDLVRSVDGIPFAGWHRVDWKPTMLLGIERNGLDLSLPITPVPMVRRALWQTMGFIAILAVFWVITILLLIRRFQQMPVRLLFLLGQTIALLTAQSTPYPWPIPGWLLILSTLCFHLMIFLFMHLHLVFPVLVGTRHLRRGLLAINLALALALSIFYLFRADPGLKLSNLYSVLTITATVIVVVYVYQCRASAADRRRLRLVILITSLCMASLIFGLALPNIAGQKPLILSWQLGFLLSVIPLAYLYATARHNLFGIDRLLNHTLVYAILSTSLLALYLGPVLLLYRLLPGDVLLQAIVVTALTMLIGLSFNWARAQAQRLVDQFFYGGWYDYPGVVGAISAILARTVEREQLIDALTRQVPAMMQLHGGQLWIGKHDSPVHPPTPLQAAPPAHSSASLPSYQAVSLQFPLAFQGHIKGLWQVEPRLDGDDFAATDRRILQTLARQAEITLGNVLMVEALRQQLDEIRASRETLRQAQRQLLRSREEERARLARELHDGPLQNLAGLELQLELLTASPDPSNTPLADTLKEMHVEVQALRSELSQVCAELRPPTLDTLGLGAALRDLAKEWSALHNIAIHLDLPPDSTLHSLPDQVTVNLYRVTQEALANIARHALAQQVSLTLAHHAQHLTLTIQDDGRGFASQAPGDLITQGHFGLLGMQERIDLIGGHLIVESAPKRGTSVQAILHAPTLETCH